MCIRDRVYEEPDATDGYRVLVDRLWPRGIKKEHLDRAAHLSKVINLPAGFPFGGSDVVYELSLIHIY